MKWKLIVWVKAVSFYIEHMILFKCMVWNDHIIFRRLMQSHKFKWWGKTFQFKQIHNKIPTNIQSNIQSVERSCSILDHPKIPEHHQYANINIASVLSRFVWLTPMPWICKARHIVFDSSAVHDIHIGHTEREDHKCIGKILLERNIQLADLICNWIDAEQKGWLECSILCEREVRRVLVPAFQMLFMNSRCGNEMENIRATSHIHSGNDNKNRKEANWNVELLSVETRAIANEIENYLCDLGPGINLFFLVLIRFFFRSALFTLPSLKRFFVGFSVFCVCFCVLLYFMCANYNRFHQNEWRKRARKRTTRAAAAAIFNNVTFTTLWHFWCVCVCVCNKINAKIMKQSEANTRNKNYCVMIWCCCCCRSMTAFDMTVYLPEII